jgi:UDP-GlcNAc3NAcA epimerase
MKICTIVGARPQFIKAAVVSRAISVLNQSAPNSVSEFIIHTGQHFDSNMSDIFFRELELPTPNLNLGIGGGTHGQNTGRMLERIESVLLSEKPNWVLVYGDTDSTLAGALAAAKLHIPIAHVEAGLRSYNRRMPEEINRVLTDHISNRLFTPTPTATSNLQQEGISTDLITQVGDVMLDAARYYSQVAERSSQIIQRLQLKTKAYLLATVHRAENTDNPDCLKEIVEGLSNTKYPVVLPIHPRLSKNLTHFGLTLPTNVIVIDPVGYLDMVMLEKSALAIITDSGGVQKEAYFHGVPCITMRDETEWVETLANGWNKLVGANAANITKEIAAIAVPSSAPLNLYGDGHAGDHIVDTLRVSLEK